MAVAVPCPLNLLPMHQTRVQSAAVPAGVVPRVERELELRPPDRKLALAGHNEPNGHRKSILHQCTVRPHEVASVVEVRNVEWHYDTDGVARRLWRGGLDLAHLSRGRARLAETGQASGWRRRARCLGQVSASFLLPATVS
eukprot:scaffold47379_cov67-Phaeocystis_antarctica.AAC.8